MYAEEKAKEKKLTFHFHTDREKIYIQMDAIKLESILDNLLSNAVKYTPEEGEVTLRLQASDKEVHISVSDTGIGVPRQDQPQLLQLAHGLAVLMPQKEELEILNGYRTIFGKDLYGTAWW